MKKIAIAISLFVWKASHSQDTVAKVQPFAFTGFMEAYFSYDFDKPANNNRPNFIYSHNRHNEFNVNLAFAKVSYNTDKIRGNFALAAGTYVNANYAAEPGVLKNLYEANVGVKISSKKNLWVDAGIFSSHIGFEVAPSSSDPTLTRSIIADNSPYFESGAKMTFVTDNKKWLVSALALNGWQRIQRVPGNSLMSWGTQISFTPSSKTSINYSTFLGTDKPDSARLWRFFHDLYGTFNLTEKFELVLCFDIGQQQANKGSNNYDTWYGTAVIVHYSFAKSWSAAIRGEYYDDKNGVIISTGTPNGFKTSGFSMNFDKSFSDHLLWRTEVRLFNSKDEIFIKNDDPVNNNTAVTTSLALTF